MDHPDLTITRVHATPLNLPVTMGGRITSLSICLVDVETSAGITGTGMTAITEEEVVASIVNDVAAHALVGRDPMRHEQLWDRLYWLLTPRVLLVCIPSAAAKGPPMACLCEPSGDPSRSAVFGAGARRRKNGLPLCADVRQTMPAPATTWAGCDCWMSRRF